LHHTLGHIIDNNIQVEVGVTRHLGENHNFCATSPLKQKVYDILESPAETKMFLIDLLFHMTQLLHKNNTESHLAIQSGIRGKRTHELFS